MADAVKAVGQNVQKEAADELVCIERHEAVARLTLASIIFPFEGDTLAIEGEEARVGDCRAVGVAGEIGEHLVGAGERAFGVDHPFHTAKRLEEGSECIGIMKRGIVAEELQPTLGVHVGT